MNLEIKDVSRTT